MENLLDNINIIYNRKRNLWKLIRDKPEKKSYERDNVYNKDWFIIKNDGGGDCFFYSVIDSNIELIHKGENLRVTYQNNIEGFVKKLRSIGIEHIKGLDEGSKDSVIIGKKAEYEEELYNTFGTADTSEINQIIKETDDPATAIEYIDILKKNFLFNNFEEWYDAMLRSNYWADDTMISAFTNMFKIIPVLIETNTLEITCSLISLESFSNIEDLLRNSEDYKYIVIWYEKLMHFESMKTNDKSGKLVEYFGDFKHLEKIVPDLAYHIINDCGFQKLVDIY